MAACCARTSVISTATSAWAGLCCGACAGAEEASVMSAQNANRSVGFIDSIFPPEQFAFRHLNLHRLALLQFEAKMLAGFRMMSGLWMKSLLCFGNESGRQ